MLYRIVKLCQIYVKKTVQSVKTKIKIVNHNRKELKTYSLVKMQLKKTLSFGALT